MNIKVIMLAVCAMSASCAHFYSRDDLTMSLTKHHVDLRWGRLENAAIAVVPSMQGQFLQHWAERSQAIELQDIEVVGMTIDDETNTATVMVRIVWVDRLSMAVQTSMTTETWTRTGDGWLCSVPARFEPPLQ
jgi:hypothetical protein